MWYLIGVLAFYAVAVWLIRLELKVQRDETNRR
jgi:hypothetical protein